MDLNDEQSNIIENEMKTIELIVSAVEHSIKVSDEDTYVRGLRALGTLLNSYPNTRVMSEFSFFITLNLLEEWVSRESLFLFVVQFSEQLFAIQTPNIIPVNKFKNFLSKVIQNLQNIVSLTDSQTDVSNRSRLNAVIVLIKRFLLLINKCKEEEFPSDDENFHVFKNKRRTHLERNFTSEGFQAMESMSDEDYNETDITELLVYCLSNVEMIFMSFRNCFIDDNSGESLQMFHDLCLCQLIVVENNLCANESQIQFVRKMFSNGNVSYLLNLLLIGSNNSQDSNERQFLYTLSSLLSNFIIKVQNLNQNAFDEGFEQLFNVEDLKQGFNYLIDKGQHMNDEEKNKFHESFIALNYYCLVFGSNFTFDDKTIIERVVKNYIKSNIYNEKYLAKTVRHVLFLAVFIDLDQFCVTVLRELFQNKERSVLSQYYTNHIHLIVWLFDRLNCDNFSEFALNRFMESFRNDIIAIDRKEIIIEFMKFINSNETAFQVLIRIICGSMASHSVFNFIQNLLISGDQFIDENIVYNCWSEFDNKVSIHLPKIIMNTIEKIKCIAITENIDFHWEQTLSKLIQVSSQKLSDEIKVNIFSNQNEFYELVSELCDFINRDLSQSTIESIFEFFKICLIISSSDSIINRKALTQTILDSRESIVLMVGLATNDSTKAQLKELSIFLLTTLSESKLEFKLEHNLMYNLEIKTLSNWFNSNSQVICKSALSLLIHSFNAIHYFGSNIPKLDEYMANNPLIEEKVENFMNLLISIQNAVFKTYITLKEMIDIWNKIFNALIDVSVELFYHLVNNPWFRIVIESIIGMLSIEGQHLYSNEDLFDFLILFYKQSTINRALIGITNKMVQTLVQSLESPDQHLINKRKSILKVIYYGVYRHILEPNNWKSLHNVINNFHN